MAPERHRGRVWWFVESTDRRESPTSIMATVGVDIAKRLLQVDGRDETGAVVDLRRCRRGAITPRNSQSRLKAGTIRSPAALSGVAIRGKAILSE